MASKLLLALLLCTVSSLSSAASASSGRRRQLRDDSVQAAIVGGTLAAKGRYPWIVSLRINDAYKSHFCGGTLITPWFVMTAAHCLVDDTTGDLASPEQSFPEVRIGGWELYGGSYEVRQVSYVYVHDGYDPETSDNDIALLMLDTASKKQPIKLAAATPNPPVAPGTLLYAAGWGLTTDNGNEAQQLREVSLDLLSQAACGAAFDDPYWKYSTLVCAGSGRRHKDTCQGDSGGPLFIKGKNATQDKQVGITSFGIGACASSPGAYSSVMKLRSWIGTASAAMWRARNQRRTKRGEITRPLPKGLHRRPPH